MKGLDLNKRHGIFFALLVSVLFLIIYATLLLNPQLQTHMTQVVIYPLQEFRNASLLKACKEINRTGGVAVFTNMTVPSWAEVERQSLGVLSGGKYKPKSCMPDSHVAIVVPYRNRETQLRIFLKHIHPFLRNQFVHYRIFIIELAEGVTFNRGALFNVGFKEASKLDTFDCFIFHDVDLLPMDSRNNYTCARMPLHLSSAINKHRFRLPYKTYFGGAVAISRRQFEAINGCSNVFFGWGGEDDDFYRRVTHRNMTVLRYSPNIASYRMIPHRRDQSRNKHAYSLLRSSTSRMATDGLNSIQYKVLRLESLPLYTRVLVAMNETTTKA